MPARLIQNPTPKQLVERQRTRHRQVREHAQGITKPWQPARTRVRRDQAWQADRVAKKRRLREEILTQLGRRCTQCGFADERALQIDHVAGDGARDRALGDGWNLQYYRRIERSIQAAEGRYQLLCANCNWIKRLTDQAPPALAIVRPAGQLPLL